MSKIEKKQNCIRQNIKIKPNNSGLDFSLIYSAHHAPKQSCVFSLELSENIYFSYKLNIFFLFPVKSLQNWNIQVLQIFTIISPKQ